jgi:glyoxylase-like metal-dependent hydrolase (beta-lactamase superfamily II)
MNFKKEITMSTESYRFKVGSFECIVVSDGTVAYPRPAQNVSINFFVDAPKERLGRVLRRHNLDPERWEQYVSPYLCLVISTGQHRVLVDTGMGGFAPSTGRLIPNLLNEGIAPRDIDTVILTHGHADHIGGSVDSKGKPAFPNARYIMWKDEWDFWTSKPSLAELRVDQHVKEAIVKAAYYILPAIKAQVNLIDHEGEIVPGIRAVAASGHTPGHIAVVVSSSGEQLLCISDAAIHPIHLEEPDWYSAVAINPEKVVDTRRRLLERAATEKALVLAFHFPFPGLGHVVQKGEGWQWQPIETTG